MTQKEIIELLDSKKIITKTSVYENRNNEQITDITFNSKECTSGCAFCAKGVNFKEEYIQDAINRGATLIISEKEYDIKDTGIIIVSDVRLAMVAVAEVFFDRPYQKIKMIGLTGTKGKTTTATYINNIFNEYMKKKTAILSTIVTYTGKREEESHLSTPEAIELQRYIKEAADSNLEFLTMEVSSQSYKTKRILDMRFDLGIFLNISEDHISPAEHPNFMDYFNSKLEFIKNCEKVVINYNTDYLPAVLESTQGAKKVILFGKEEDKQKVDYYYTNVKNEDEILSFDLVYGENKETYKTKMVGRFNVENAVTAIITAKEFNIPYETIYEGIFKTTVSGRMNIFKKNNKTIIVDYAHNKISFEKFFEAVKEDYPNAKIYAVFGSAGGKAYGRRKDLATVASRYCEKIYYTEEDPQFEKVIDICSEMASFTTCNYEIIEDREEAIKKAYNDLKAGDVLCLLAKGEENYQKVKGKFEPYASDIVIAKRLIDEE